LVQIKNLKAKNFLTEIMASETEFNEFVSFYGDDHKPSKKTELKRKAFENLAEIEIDEKCPVKGGKISKRYYKNGAILKKKLTKFLGFYRSIMVLDCPNCYVLLIFANSFRTDTNHFGKDKAKEDLKLII
jgi:hypothetical protein